MKPKYLFIDRDGTLIREPADFQVDSLHKLALVDAVIPSLLKLQAAGWQLVMVSNQDGLGTAVFPRQQFQPVHDLMMQLFESQGVRFEAVKICPHLPEDGCDCRKPRTGLVAEWLKRDDWDRANSYVIGDRASDQALAENMGLRAFCLDNSATWPAIVEALLEQPRSASVSRKTAETDIQCTVNLDTPGASDIDTGIGFFDHMLEQLAKHGGFSLRLSCRGDTHIDDHHSVEDCALALGQALRTALGDKRGIGRYGFVLPMDEVRAEATLDLSGRPCLRFTGEFTQERVGQLNTQMIPHFFRSLCDQLGATLHVRFDTGNAHHQAEGVFKAVAKCLAQALRREGRELPSTKGCL
jgi:imidazoleglycerol-phosphate dehydratase/histidinol-phosphatase